MVDETEFDIMDADDESRKDDFLNGSKPKCLVCNHTIENAGIAINGDHFHNECTPEGDPNYESIEADMRSPFSNEKHKDLLYAANTINCNSELTVELLDAMLGRYKSGDTLIESVNFAKCEWDC